jgi:nicotinate-nucleotide adenylyltransferase
VNSIGVFGGTFDPVHYGHLRSAFELLQAIDLDEVRFIPCGRPPHRDSPVASPESRLAMVRASIQEQPGFRVDDRELRRSGPSYSVDTLSALRAEYPDSSLCLIVGMDAFLGLTDWHRWQHLLDLGHIIVAHRPGWRTPATGALGELIAEHGTGDPRDLLRTPAGSIYVHAVSQLEISSSGLRQMIGDGGDPRFLVPEAVRDLILSSNCYRRQSEAVTGRA